MKPLIGLSAKSRFGYVPDPDTDMCADAAKDETLCESCKYYEEHHGIPTCNGNEYEVKE